MKDHIIVGESKSLIRKRGVTLAPLFTVVNRFATTAPRSPTRLESFTQVVTSGAIPKPLEFDVAIRAEAELAGYAKRLSTVVEERNDHQGAYGDGTAVDVLWRAVKVTRSRRQVIGPWVEDDESICMHV